MRGGGINATTSRQTRDYRGGGKSDGDSDGDGNAACHHDGDGDGDGDENNEGNSGWQAAMEKAMPATTKFKQQST